MLVNKLQFPTGGMCELYLDECDGWLHAKWSGAINNHDALAGAQAYLEKVRSFPCPYLLNDNQALHGPWFSSVEWLAHAWLPQAEHLGLRWIAHVVQADTHSDILSLTLPEQVRGKIELQLFDRLPDAQDWLRSCQ